ncbi:MAG: hypothetical protein ABI668_02385 [Sphingorhabdus sp.]
MDPDARVVHAIEYQGSGHHQGTAAARDAVKKEALRGSGHRLSLGGRGAPSGRRFAAAGREVGARGLIGVASPE